MIRKNDQHNPCGLSVRMIIGALAAAGIVGAIAIPASPAFAGVNNDVSLRQKPTEDRSVAVVVLNGEPLSTSAKTRPPKGKKIDFNSNTVKSYRAQLSALRNDYKQWLKTNLPNVKVTGEFDLALNAVTLQLNGATLAQVSAFHRVARASYQGLYYPVAVDPDLALIRAPEAWATSGGPANAGAGVKVAVIDSGIDVTHPCFSDAGYPAQTQTGDRRFTNNKVIVAKVFNNRAGQMNLTPEAVGAHGTHVSGTVACNYGTAANVDGAVIPHTISGVAPRALLGNYNVFPGQVESARSEDIYKAMEAAYQDGFDIVNMSLGGGHRGVLDIETQAVNNLDQANLLFAIAAGNEGPGYGTVGSPGSAERALTAGASTIGHKIVTMISAGGQSFQSIKGEFGSVPPAGLTAPLAVVADPASPNGGLSDMCAARPAGSLSGAIALLSRGTCDFTVKLRNAQAAGAVGAIVVNREAGDPFVMGQNGEASQPTIPGYMVGLSDRAALMASNGAMTTIPAIGTYVYDAARNDYMADFSSWGPTPVDARAKPDVVAPGANILSSVPASACAAPPCFAFYNGTSMATPHLAGTAAVLRSQHPSWSAAEIRSAIVNTAVRGVLKNVNGTPATDVNLIGAGREDVLNATSATVALDPVSISFGSVPAGSGQSRSIDVTLRNLGSAWQTLSLSTSGSTAGMSFTVSQGSVTLAPGASAAVQVNMQAAKGVPAGHHQGFLEVRAGNAELAHAVIFTVVK